MAELTPMMRQYLEIKERHPDCILFFRLGDFYEMFADDAKLASHELDLTLTTRDRGKEKSEQVPMCGVPYHSAESYIARLVARGYKVAICEQMEDPALAKGLVKRDITRIVTPGTVIESSMLDESRNNYFACVFGEGGRYGLSFCDISTGAFYATQAEGAEAMERVISELGRFAPAEVLRGGDAAKSEELTRTLQERLSCCADLGADELFDPQEPAQRVEQQFGRPLDELGLTERPEVWRSAGADGDHARGGKARQPPVGAGPYQNGHGQPYAAQLAGKAAAQPEAHQRAPRRRGGADEKQHRPRRACAHAAGCLGL